MSGYTMENQNIIQAELRRIANPEKAKVLQKFFKTGKGEYAEGDIFLGISVPESRKIAKKYRAISFEEIKLLLQSKIHEARLIALLILVDNFKKSKKVPFEQRKIFEFYLANTKHINNWDLVDLSAEKIVGEFVFKDGNNLLRFLANSQNLWERRIAIISTFAFLKKRKFGETLAISEMLLKDEHDLIHKAVGWMLREVGKRDIDVLEIFLKSHYKEMPRTMLRYAIEKFPEEKRQMYLKGEV
jgi:3-methyladenine DNA glycosylase AlkD